MQLSRFSEDYCAARKRFRLAAAGADWCVESYPIATPGPNGQKLTIDVAISPENDAERAVVISSGLHGVELPLGSAVQAAVLERWPEISRGGRPLRCVLWHGLNPYGAAWSCRTNEDNVDLNRNFLLPGETFAGSPPGYAELNALLNPACRPRRFDGFYPRAAAAVLRHGMPKLRQAIAAGQYDYPRGIFFGGKAPSATQRIVAEHLPRHLQGIREVVHLDFHTGLGAWASGKLLIETALTDVQQRRMDEWFGPSAYEVAHSSGIAYESRGGWGRWCAAGNFAEDYLFACAEIGTYGPLKVLAGLRRENQARHFAAADALVTRAAKSRLRELFCPSSAEWRQKSLALGSEWVRRAAQGLATADESPTPRPCVPPSA